MHSLVGGLRGLQALESSVLPVRVSIHKEKVLELKSNPATPVLDTGVLANRSLPFCVLHTLY